jgi:transcriptional regulator with XRE-family HTH domain
MAENNHPLAQWRSRQQKTQQAFASELRVAPLTVWRWENRKRTPRLKDAKRISDKTGISVGDLMEAAQ